MNRMGKRTFSGALFWTIFCLLLFVVELNTAQAEESGQRKRVNKFGEATEDLTFAAVEFAAALRTLRNSTRREHEAQTVVDELLETNKLPVRLRFSAADRHTSRTCRLCHMVAEALLSAVRHDNMTGDRLFGLLAEFCLRANIIAPHICKGMVYSNGPILEYIVQNKPSLDGPYICGTLLPDCHDGSPRLQWHLTVDMGQKPKKKPHKPMGELDPPPRPEPYRILQISDYHWDSQYAVGGNAECGEPTCCRKSQGKPQRPEARAGRWGDYRHCDVPLETVKEFTRHIADKHKDLDIIYFTGDIVDHGVWETSREHNEQVIRTTVEEMKKTFGDTKVFPLLGNHEPHPMNAFAPTNITDEVLSSNWLYELLADLWSVWLPPETKETIKRGGFYTVLVEEGFRVVGLNNMFCYSLNWWMLYDPVDPSGQLEWLVGVLLEAEKAGEKVHILAHIPTGNSDCLEDWGREYARIVDRFSDTITAQFNGHTHFDEFSIFYGAEDDLPNNVAFNGGSLTPYTDVNPNYKIYLVDGKHKKATWEILDMELWGFNLTAANLPETEFPEWYRMYSFKKTYGLESLHPIHMNMMVERMARDSDLQQLFYRYYMTESDPGIARGCDNVCIESLLCKTVTTVTNHLDHCKRILDIKNSLN